MKPKTGKLAEEADLKKDLADDATRKKIKKHLSDINDVITDDDIRNAKVPGKKARPSAKSKKQVKDDSDDTPLTTWNILED